MNAAPGSLTMHMHTIIIGLAMLAGTLGLGGCNILTPAAFLLTPPPTNPAEYELEDRPTVVFIDDRDSVVNPVSLRRKIGDKVSEVLMQRELVSQTIRPHDAMGVAARYDRRKEVMPIDAIGRAVNAEQVIYVEMLTFVDHIDGQTPRALGTARVRVIDVTNRKRLYPSPESDQPYRLVEVLTREFSQDAYASRATRIQIYEQLADELGDAIAKLFYKHETRPLGQRLGGR